MDGRDRARIRRLPRLRDGAAPDVPADQRLGPRGRAQFPPHDREAGLGHPAGSGRRGAGPHGLCRTGACAPVRQPRPLPRRPARPDGTAGAADRADVGPQCHAAALDRHVAAARLRRLDHRLDQRPRHPGQRRPVRCRGLCRIPGGLHPPPRPQPSRGGGLSARAAGAGRDRDAGAGRARGAAPHPDADRRPDRPRRRRDRRYRFRPSRHDGRAGRVHDPAGRVQVSRRGPDGLSRPRAAVLVHRHERRNARPRIRRPDPGRGQRHRVRKRQAQQVLRRIPGRDGHDGRVLFVHRRTHLPERRGREERLHGARPPGG